MIQGSFQHTLSLTNRHLNEISHGQHIAGHAEAVWGWDRPTGPARLKRRTDFLIHYGALKSDASVLEIGCGTGVVTEYLARSGASITGIDLSPHLLGKALDRKVSDRVTFRVGNAEALDFPDSSFDAVVGSSVLHHLDLDRALDEIRRVLRPGGRMAFSEPNMLNPHIFVQKNIPWVKRLAGDSPDETAFFRWAISNRLRLAGFADPEVIPYDFLHPAVPAPFIPSVSHLSRFLEQMPLIRELAGSLILSAEKPEMQLP